MKKNVMFKSFLTAFLMVLCLGLTNNVNAQIESAMESQAAPDLILEKANASASSQNISQEIKVLKSSVGNLTPGSEAHVDAMRRIEAFARTSKAINRGLAPKDALKVGYAYLDQLEIKSAEKSKIRAIKTKLVQLFTN